MPCTDQHPGLTLCLNTKLIHCSADVIKIEHPTRGGEFWLKSILHNFNITMQMTHEHGDLHMLNILTAQKDLAKVHIILVYVRFERIRLTDC